MLVVGNIRQAVGGNVGYLRCVLYALVQDALEIAKMVEDIIEPKQLPNDTNLEYLSRLLPPSKIYYTQYALPLLNLHVHQAAITYGKRIASIRPK